MAALVQKILNPYAKSKATSWEGFYLLAKRIIICPMLRLLLLLIFLISKKLDAQDTDRVTGIITVSGFTASDAHVYNQTRGKGTISKKDGTFTLNSKIQDTLLISLLGYHTKKVILNSHHFSNSIKVQLVANRNTLDEVTIYQYGLTGNLESDSKQISPLPQQLPLLQRRILG